MSKTPQQLYQERQKRVSDAIALKRPDRIPVFGETARYARECLGISDEERWRNVEKALEAAFQSAVYFEPDLGGFDLGAGNAAIVPVLGPLDCKRYMWAGHGLPANAGTPQWVQAEIMSADEYDALIYDPSDFVARKYWPRAYAKLAGLALLPPIREGMDLYGAPTSFAVFGTTEGLEALDTLRQAGQAAQEIAVLMKNWTERMKQAGFPLFFSGRVCQTPFDMICDFLRGQKGIMMDMYRRPEKLLKACEKLLPMTVEGLVRSAKGPGSSLVGWSETGSSLVGLGLRGSMEGFMSLQQFQRFFWPTVREAMVALVKEGLTVMLFCEGDLTSRLETMSDVPPGKIFYWLERVDLVKAKKILGDKVCISGNVPISLLATGTPDDVRAYCKKIIDIMGKEGGLILGPSGMTDEARVENVKVMIDFTKEYGVC
ncbi:MAG: uroporphyrinogen decarboxylase family protein [Terriglobales bacterium]